MWLLVLFPPLGHDDKETPHHVVIAQLLIGALGFTTHPRSCKKTKFLKKVNIKSFEWLQRACHIFKGPFSAAQETRVRCRGIKKRSRCGNPRHPNHKLDLENYFLVLLPTSFFIVHLSTIYSFTLCLVIIRLPCHSTLKGQLDFLQTQYHINSAD
jgi:hypothetical protein